MKKLLFIFGLFLVVMPVIAGTTNDSINVAGITGTDTVIIISKSFLNWGRAFSIEAEYSDLSHDDATFDIGTRLEIPGGSFKNIADSTFNSYSDILGISFPITLDVTTNADSYYGKSSFLIWHEDRLPGTEILLKINPGSVTSGYIRYKIIW